MLNKPLTLVIVLCSFQLVAQTIEKGYYMFPVRPGEVNYLAGTMGELRSGHFHTGLDIKTSGITGLPIFASAGGYVQRVKISLGGYGNALYLDHPNGTTTVYAHLQEFQDDLARYVREQQYKQESFTVDLTLPKNKFIFKKGDVIALSGNSGSSSGPHLHFEIRDENQKVLNPLDYGFDEIKDDVAPTLHKVAFVTMDKNSRVNGMFGRFEYNIIEQDGKHLLELPVTLFGNIGVEVYAYDRMNGARNKNGVLVQSLMFDYELVFSQNIEKIEFNRQRNILAHINYKSSQEGRRRFNKYYVDDGNFLPFYSTNDKSGIISIFDPLEHSIDIQLEDPYHNVIQYHLPLNDAGYTKILKQKNMYFLNLQGYDVRKNILEIMADIKEEDCFARIFVDGKEHLYAHAYRAEGKYFYLWNLSDGLPDSADVCGKKLMFKFKEMIPSGSKTVFSNESIEMSFPKHSLFDTLYFQYEENLDKIHQREYFHFQHPDIPLRRSANITIKPKLKYDVEHSAIYAVGRKNLTFVGGKWEGDYLKLETRDLVKFTIATDTIPPEIKRLKSSKTSLKLKIEDEMSGIKSMRAELDGKWLLMPYDAKTGVVVADPNVKLKGSFSIVVEDNANNFSKFATTF